MNGCKRYSLLTVLIVLALLLTGCGGANVTEEEAAEEVPTAETDANSGPESTSSDTSSVEAEMAEAMEQEVAEAEATTTPTSDAVLKQRLLSTNRSLSQILALTTHIQKSVFPAMLSARW